MKRFVGAMDEGEWSASLPGRIILEEMGPGTRGQETGWVSERLWTL
jgi:hypothetical protein